MDGNIAWSIFFPQLLYVVNTFFLNTTTNSIILLVNFDAGYEEAQGNNKMYIYLSFII